MLARTSHWRRWLVAVASVISLAAPTIAAADPPSRVARLAYADGNVSFSPAGDDEWVRAVLNRPLVAGDRLWIDERSRAELSLTGTSARFGPFTSVTLLNLDDRTQQLQLTQGVVHLQVRRLGPGEILEVDTPNFAFTVTRPGSFRIEVDSENGSSLIAVRSGDGAVYGEGAAYTIRAGQAFRYYGTDLRDQEYLALPALDEFERWSLSRERRFERALAARYVAPEVIGYEDLDAYGSWQVVADYGSVWVPADVPSGWAPYRNGHWSWVDPWGWTWIDDAPWGFAPFHYGRWAVVRDRWCWVPGPSRVRPVYAPALVAFVGGSSFSVSVAGGGAIGWFPLGPGEVYRPAYDVSRDYFTRVNVTNTVVNITQVTNVYNSRNATDVRYAHMQRPGAITAVPQSVFAQAQPVRRAAVAVTPQALNRAEVLPRATVAPQRVSVTGGAPANVRPPPAVQTREVVAKAPPPRGRAAAGAPNVRVVTAASPAPAPAASSVPPAQAQRRDRDRSNGPERPESARGRPPPQGMPDQAQLRPEPRRPTAQAPEPPQDRGRGRPSGGPPGTPPSAVSPAPAPQTAQPTRPDQRPEREAREPRGGRPDQARGRAEPPPGALQAPPTTAPPPQAQRAPEQRRGPPEQRAMPQQQQPPAPQAAPPPQAQRAPEQRRGPPEQRAMPQQQQPPAPSPQQAGPPSGPPSERGRGRSEERRESRRDENDRRS